MNAIDGYPVHGCFIYLADSCPRFRADNKMRTALDALSAEHGAAIRLPPAASRSGMSTRLVLRHVDALAHPFELAHMHNNMHA